jgi:carboxyl-terminal processing protease
MRNLFFRQVLLVAASVLVALTTPSAGRAGPLACDTIIKLTSRYLDQHIRYRSLTPELRDRTIDVFLRSFDPSQSALLESEFEALKGSIEKVFGQIQKGDCTALSTVHQTFSKRQQEIAEFVKEFVSADDYEIDQETELVLDAKKRGYPKTAADRDALTRSLIHFQMSNYVSEATTLEEAKSLITHRYKLRSERISEIDAVDLYSAFLDAFATSLDPHSNYFSADTYEDFRINMSLSLIGIGVALSERDGFAVVERIIPGGAAAQLDVLKPKDKIIEVAQAGEEPVNIIDMPLRDAVSLIRGKKGTEVRLTILRQAETTERFGVAIVRDEISLEDSAASLRIEEREFNGRKVQLGILDLPSFYGDNDPKKRQCTDDVAKLLNEANEAGVDGLVLDLSRNGGGLLTHAVTVSGFFLRRGEIVTVSNAVGHKSILSDRDESILYSGPLVLHTSRVSASAAEILAGALKDYKRAVIAGDDHTFGKGTVQTVSSLPPDQGAIKITTAMFYRPGGRSTQNDGVEADVVIPSELGGDDYGEKHQPYALEGKSIQPFQSSYAITNPRINRWHVISQDLITRLSKKSGERIQESSKFSELFERIKEREKNAGTIRLSDVNQKRKEEREKEAQEEEGASEDGESVEDVTSEDDEKEPSLQLAEATNVLMDLIALSPVRRVASDYQSVTAE